MCSTLDARSPMLGVCCSLLDQNGRLCSRDAHWPWLQLRALESLDATTAERCLSFMLCRRSCRGGASIYLRMCRNYSLPSISRGVPANVLLASFDRLTFAVSHLRAVCCGSTGIPLHFGCSFRRVRANSVSTFAEPLPKSTLKSSKNQLLSVVPQQPSSVCEIVF